MRIFKITFLACLILFAASVLAFGAPASTPTTLTLLIRDQSAGAGYDNFTTHYIEKVTNTKWDITAVPPDDLETKLNLVLASGGRPDIIQYEEDGTEVKLAEGGVLYAVNKSFTAAPNLAKYGAGGIWDSMRFADGNIYSVPIRTQAVEYVPIYRQDWLQKLGMTIPTTLDQYLKVADAITNRDPDGNGKKDTYAFGAFGVGNIKNFHHLFGAYGVLPPSWHVVDGHLQNDAILPGAKQALQFINKLYTMGVIDPEFVTDKEARYKEKVMSGMFGALNYKIYLFDKANLYNYNKVFFTNNPQAVLAWGPVLGGGSPKPLGSAANSLRGWLKTGITSSSKNIEAAIRVLDYLASPEGSMLQNYGEKGVDYSVGADGVVKRLITTEQMLARGITQNYLATTALFLHTSPEYQKALAYANSIMAKDPGDGLLVPEDSVFYDLWDYMAAQYAQMMVGQIPIEGGFERFVAEWNKRGGDALQKAKDAAYQKRK